MSRVKTKVKIYGVEISESNFASYDDIVSNNELRPEQKLAMTIIKTCERDVHRILPKAQARRTLADKSDLESALEMLIGDFHSLDFWCTIAGWNTEWIREQSLQIVQRLREGKIAVAQRDRIRKSRTARCSPGRPRIKDEDLSRGGLRSRQYRERQKENDGKDNSDIW